MVSLSAAYSLILPHYQQTTTSQSVKCFIYSHFIITIYKSQLTFHFLNSDTPTQQLQPKKKKKEHQEFEKDIGTQVPNTITYSNSIHNHPKEKKKKRKKKKKKKPQSQIHKNYKCMVYMEWREKNYINVRFWSLRREKTLKMVDRYFWMEAWGCNSRRRWWDGQIKLQEALRAIVACGSMGELWQWRKGDLTFVAAT